MCEYCKDIVIDNRHAFEDGDGIMYNTKEKVFELVIEHFRNEINSIDISNCPKCGRKLNRNDIEC